MTEASDSEFWENVITAEDGVITVRCAVHTLQLSVRAFFKTNFSTKEVVSKMRNAARKTHKQNIRERFKHNDKPFPRLDYETLWDSTFQCYEVCCSSRIYRENRSDQRISPFVRRRLVSRTGAYVVEDFKNFGKK